MWTCSGCGATVEDQFDACWSCGTSRDGVPDPNFVRADDAGPIPDAPEPVVVEGIVGHDDVLVEAYRALDLQEAQFLAGQLAEAGFHATADELDMHVALGGMTSDPRVYVREADLPAAREWLADYDRNKQISTRTDTDTAD